VALARLAAVSSRGRTIILVRHAESAPDFSLPEADWPLSACGREQADRLAEELRIERIDRICSSPYLRALDTVRPLSRELGVPIEVYDDLRERKLAPGRLPNVLEMIERSWSDFDFALPGCESARQAQARAVAAIDALAGEVVLVSSHGQLISLYLNALDPKFGFEGWRSMSNPQVFRLSRDLT
jgi:2,3-bisphosphoglycerate-dependent phosphoglycerate mutase